MAHYAVAAALAVVDCALLLCIRASVSKQHQTLLPLAELCCQPGLLGNAFLPGSPPAAAHLLPLQLLL
jgi:hypothetical protein